MRCCAMLTSKAASTRRSGLTDFSRAHRGKESAKDALNEDPLLLWRHSSLQGSRCPGRISHALARRGCPQEPNAQPARQRNAYAGRPRHADGQPDAPLLAAGAALARAAGAGLPAGARAPAGRGPDRLPRHLRRASASCTNACPHRGASMFFGRNEEDGLRCVYHGWKFDVDRRLRRHAVRAGRVELQEQGAHRRAYPTQERGGIVWAYMGPPETMKPFREPAPSTPARAVADRARPVRLQLGAGPGRQPGHVPHLLPAPQPGALRPGAGRRRPARRPVERDVDLHPGPRPAPRASRYRRPGTASATPACARRPPATRTCE